MDLPKVGPLETQAAEVGKGPHAFPVRLNGLVLNATAVGGRLNDALALGGMLDGQLLFRGGVLMIFTLAPALRLGDVGHATVGLGPSLIYLFTQEYLSGIPGSSFSGTGLAGSFVVHGAVPLSGGFGVHPRLGLTFGTGTVILTLSFGFGGSVF